VVEVGKIAVFGAHPLAGVQDEHDLLVALVLVLSGDQLREPGGRAPVDLSR